MATAFVAGSTGGAAGAAGATLAKPTGTLDTDSLWVIFQHASAAASITVVPTGWVQHGSTASVGTAKMYVYQKIASGEPASWFWQFNAAATWCGCAVAFSGVSNASPISANSTGSNVGTTVVLPSISPPDAATMLITLGSCDANSGPNAPAGMTEAADIGQGTNRTQVCYQQLTATGATGTRTINWVSAVSSFGHIIALKPGGAVVATSTASLLVAGP